MAGAGVDDADEAAVAARLYIAGVRFFFEQTNQFLIRSLGSFCWRQFSGGFGGRDVPPFRICNAGWGWRVLDGSGKPYWPQMDADGRR